MSWEDNVEPIDLEEIIQEYAESHEFLKSLYDNCSFIESGDDYGVWIELSNSPKAELFIDDLLEFAISYCKQVRENDLQEWEKDELVDVWKNEYHVILNDCLEWLFEKHSEESERD